MSGPLLCEKKEESSIKGDGIPVRKQLHLHRPPCDLNKYLSLNYCIIDLFPAF